MISKCLLPAVVLGSVMLNACGSADINSNNVISFDRNNWAEQEYVCPEHSLEWNQVNDWHYQLQFMDYVALSETRHDLIVIDSEPREPLNRNIIDRIRCAGDGEKLVLAYLPIGKAESYRNYWQSNWTLGNPSWIAARNEGWVDEYVVRYWEPEWKSIIMGSPESRLDVILEAGFDGVALDGVDLYQLFLEENPSAIIDMHTFISEIKSYADARTADRSFGIFVINSERLIDEPSVDWTGNLTGIIKSSHYFAPVDQPVDSEVIDFYAAQLDKWIAANKLVLTLDYASRQANIETIYNTAAERGYIPLALPSGKHNILSVPLGFEPD